VPPCGDVGLRDALAAEDHRDLDGVFKQGHAISLEQQEAVGGHEAEGERAQGEHDDEADVLSGEGAEHRSARQRQRDEGADDAGRPAAPARYPHGVRRRHACPPGARPHIRRAREER